ncbi:MAG TPA: ATP-dependent helicase [Patescibacteria group bacterium]|nr:ATP-dependent helicase [Patescibacteria group bacterium]
MSSLIREPTEPQKEIIDYPGNLVVMAKPGSGKTYTISEKIKSILKDSSAYQGVIAISFTNKASTELKQRALSYGIDSKCSFFGTMSLFYLVEIIYPFGSHVFGKPAKELKVCGKEDTSEEVQRFRQTKTLKEELALSGEDIEDLAMLYIQGNILLETIDILAVCIYDNSIACRRYIKSRYTHVIIDEFQDCGLNQYELFMRLVQSGIIGIAVGDKDQSIYGFSGKSSDYLMRLVSDPAFRPFNLDKNFRCHKSISDYSLRLLNPAYQIDSMPEKRVFKRCSKGGESAITEYIERVIPIIAKKYNILKNSDFAILVPSNPNGDLISSLLNIKHKYFKKTDLDDDSSLWATTFKILLHYIQNPNANIFEFCENYLDPNDKSSGFSRLYRLTKDVFANKPKLSTSELTDSFIKIAEIIYPKAYNNTAINNLNEVLKDNDSMDSFAPASDEEVQIMTLHKSKGLEFKAVFHLGLYKYNLPRQGKNGNGDWGYNDYEQDLNLHYVGITRAEEVCILLNSTLRHNKDGDQKAGIDSEFLTLNDLKQYQG